MMKKNENEKAMRRLNGTLQSLQGLIEKVINSGINDDIKQGIDI